jgi:hypothetical protein
VEGGVGNNAEISMEQAFLKFNLNAHQYIIAGLFTPRIGILNENHLPVNFNGVERPMVETLIIPATWRELGAGFYGNSVGFGYLPLPNVVIKADVRLMHTGPQNAALVVNPAPNALPYQQNNQYLNFGIGYSF